ncbi:MAG: hypothetical protein EHM40_05340 [Chloroflexi bacterium]|nr:MAG: hypothetical protein EHM40_05340 [Chloroflexota bacterium]
MNKITFPLKSQNKGTAVDQLHEVLAALEYPITASEKSQQRFGASTRKAVIEFQQKYGLEATGVVDKVTANVLEAVLRQSNLFSSAGSNAVQTSSSSLDARYTLVCCAVDARSDPIAGLSLEAYVQASKLPPNLLGEPATTDDEGMAVFHFRRSDFAESSGEAGPDLYFKICRGDVPLDYVVDGIPDENGLLHNFELPREQLVLRVDRHYVVKGTVRTVKGLPAASLELFANRLGFGRDVQPLGASNPITTDDYGYYSLAYDPGPVAVNLEISIRDPQDSEKFIPLMKPCFGAAPCQVLNLVAPVTTGSKESEYGCMSSDIALQTGKKKLAGGRTNVDVQDLTVLNRTTGWDARLIALAVMAERLCAEGELNLPDQQEAVYGLLRAGLPSDKLLLAQVDLETLVQALKKVSETGIVALNEEQIERFTKQFGEFASQIRLDIPVPGSNSTYRALLGSSGLSEDAQSDFNSIYLNHRGNAAQLWDKLKEANFDDDQIKALKLHGKLAFLTSNSAEVTRRLQERCTKEAITSPAQLVDLDYDLPETWVRDILAVAKVSGKSLKNLSKAKTDTLNQVIPTVYAGENVEDRLRAYAQDMARKIRLSYPTHVVGRLLERDDKFRRMIPEEDVRQETVRLLKDATARGFRLGQTPVARFFRSDQALPKNKNSKANAEAQITVQQVEKLARIYQITPDDESMPVLPQLGITSAYDVMAYSKDRFVQLFNTKYLETYNTLPSENVAQLIYRKATQVSSVIYNLFAIANEVSSAPSIPATSPSAAVTSTIRNNLIEYYPTLGTLFGSMDYCECEHCRSVLSPAAYLVDLLQFLDIEPDVWANFLAQWEDAHQADYPYQKDEEAMSPYDVLIERRPDLLHIQLTCENTNTALPYIDIVNEILEYYVANNGQLEEQAARDTGKATTAELLAEPQYVIREAYNNVLDAYYPLNLPFDLWNETVRQFCNYFEMPLDSILEAFRRSDDLFVQTQPYDRAAVFMEALGFSPAELAVFTDPNPFDPNPNAANAWYKLYGFSSAQEATNQATDNETGQRIDLNSAKALARRLGVTYKELVEVVESGFVNPMLSEIRLLYKLGVSIRDAWFYETNKNFYEQHKNLLQRIRSTLSPADQAQWDIVYEVDAFEKRLDDLADAFNTTLSTLQTEILNIPFGQILVLVDPGSECDFDRTTLQYADGHAADEIVFLRINLLVRLWRKLGWSIEEVDRALQAFVPRNAPFDGDHLDKQPLRTALIYLAHLKELDENLKVGKQSRLKLLTLWLDIPTTGKNPLYAQLFLTRSTLKSSEVEVIVNGQSHNLSVFDDPLGRYLQPTGLARIAEQVKYRVGLEHVTEDHQISASDFSGEPRIGLDYDPLGEVQYLTYLGLLSDAEKTRLLALAPSNELSELLDAVQMKGREFTIIKGHVLALQGALGLTAGEMDSILKHVGKSLDTAELSLATVSLLYRYGLLAKALKLSVSELIALKQLSGLDPFMPLHPDPLTDTPAEDASQTKAIDLDFPFSQTLRFVDVAREVQDTGLKIEDIDYLLRHRFDETGKYRPDRESTFALLRTLVEGVRAIRSEHAVPEDQNAINEQILRQKLGLSLSSDVVERLLAMVNGTVEFTATETAVKPDEGKLDPKAFEGEPVIRQISYSEARQEQKLTYRGVLFDAQKIELQERLAPELTDPQEKVLAALLDSIQKLAREFFDNHLKRQTLSLNVEAGFLDENTYDELFAPFEALWQILSTDTEEEVSQKLEESAIIESNNQNSLQQRHLHLAQSYLPFLQQRLIRQFVVQTLASFMSADPVLVESLLTDQRLLGNQQPLLDTLAAAADCGLTATFFASADGTGDTLSSTLLAEADTGLKDKDGKSLKPETAKSARIEGYLEVPMAGPYRFYLELDGQNTTAELYFDHLPEPLFLNYSKPNECLELKPGLLYRFKLVVKNLHGGRARLLVQSETLPRGGLAQLVLYPLNGVESMERAAGLLSKVLQLVQSLALSQREIRYLLTHSVDFGNINLNDLPTQPGTDAPAENVAARQRFSGFLRLAAYARLRRDLAGGTDDLIDIFESNQMNAADKLEKMVYPLIARLTRREEAVVQSVANALFAAPSFESEKPLQRLWQALQVVERFGEPVASLLEWTGIVNIRATPEQCFEIANDLKEALKVRFEPEAWQRVAQPIFDKLRQYQRDALVSYIMHQQGFARMEQLYEHFLIDPGMEPVVQTSRIRLAIASVQLFIQRCLLNMESKVHPSAIINSRHWEWMKRYRVWEANRKIFLFPENWLEPEFRDDKTHLFTELEGALLQDDVSSDLVEDAFLNYLKKLDELARLDIVAMHIEDNPDPAQRVLHVFGRTYGQAQYFYRRFAHDAWTPWEPVSVEIEGEHLAPVTWRNRLYLFWVTFIEKSPVSGKINAHSSNASLASPAVNEAGGGPSEPTQALPPPSLDSATMNKLKDQNITLSQLTLEDTLRLSGIDIETPSSSQAGATPQGANGSAPSTGITPIFETLFPIEAIDVQLYWSEYVRGEWTPQKTGGPSAIISLIVPSSFNPSSVFIHVSKARDPETGEEGGVYIHLSEPLGRSFYLAGRNSDLQQASSGPRPENKFSSAITHASRYMGSGELKVSYNERIQSNEPPSPVNPNILQTGTAYTLLPCDNDLEPLGVSTEAYQGAAHPTAVKAALEDGLKEIAALSKPVFYQDDTHTFFVRPTITEQITEKWEQYIPSHVTQTETDPQVPKKRFDVPVEQQRTLMPDKGRPPERQYSETDPRVLFAFEQKADWLVNARTVLTFDDGMVGPKGYTGLAARPEVATAGANVTLQTIQANPGSALPAGSRMVMEDASTFNQSGLVQTQRGFNVVGTTGFNSALEKNLTQMFGAGQNGR